MSIPRTEHTGRVAVVSGGAGAIGRAIALRLHAEGARVSVLDASQWRPVQTDPVRPDVRPIAFHEVDVGNESAVDAVFDAVASREGVVSYLVCCAGIFSSRPFLQLSPDDWERTIRINLTGSFLCCRAALRSMQKNGFGRIVLISSVLARGGGMNCASYAASKGGVLGLARSLALEVAGENIRVNTLTPGITDTAMPRGHISEEQLRKIASANPLGRIGRVEDMVEGCLFLLSEDSSYVTAQDLRVNGGGALW